jgi:hypothetical protein
MTGPTLTEPEVSGLSAILSELLPSSSGPGAMEAGALGYVRARLEGPLNHLVEALRPVLQRATTDAEKAVAELAAGDDPRFEELRALAWEGYLCDPRRGGNRDGVGWGRFGAPARRKARR